MTLILVDESAVEVVASVGIETGIEVAVVGSSSSSLASSVIVVSQELIFSYVEEGVVRELDLEFVAVLFEDSFAFFLPSLESPEILALLVVAGSEERALDLAISISSGH